VYIYADVFIIYNMLLNGVILLLTAALTGTDYKLWRILCAAGLGSVYALAGLYGDYGYLYVPIAKFLASLIILAAAFPFRSIKSLAVATGGFYIVSFLLGGAVMGWLFFFRQSAVTIPGDTAWLSLPGEQVAAAVLVAVLTAILVWRRLTAVTAVRRMLVTLTISYENRQTKVTAFLDTGNQLFTVAGHNPVVLVEQQALTPILSEPARDYLCRTDPVDWFTRLDCCQDEGWLTRIEIIPYHSVGMKSMLLGFRPDGIKVLTTGRETECSAAVVGIYCGRLTAEDRYQALLNPAVFRGADAKGGTQTCA
jgi:stage II sporulation protein GA (sporulation sigma-E factor processing peptidase)